MKIALFGATGTTGARLLQFALQGGHHVIALVRDPSKLKQPESEVARSRLTVVQGDLANAEAVDAVVREADVVLEVLGVPLNRPTTVKQDGARAILAAMKKHGKSRLVALSAAGANDKIKAAMPAALRWFIGSFMLNHIDDDLRAAQALIQAEGAWLDYTVVQPGRLVDAEPTRAYTVAVDEMPAGTGKLPFADVALCMLEVAEKGTYLKQFISMNTPREAVIDPHGENKARKLFLDNLKTKLLTPKGVAAAAAIALVIHRIGKRR